jgi:hypothetical protein
VKGLARLTMAGMDGVGVVLEGWLMGDDKVARLYFFVVVVSGDCWSGSLHAEGQIRWSVPVRLPDRWGGGAKE